MIRKTVHFSGNVQGVGFRWTTQRIAGGYNVTGYVKNLPDGRVELVVEGESEPVDRMIEEVEQAMGRHIRNTQVDRSQASGQFSRFGIAH
jgi:acylphosphatase